MTTFPYSSTSGAIKTIGIQVPIPTITTTKTYTESDTTSITHTALSGETAAIEIGVPISTVATLELGIGLILQLLFSQHRIILMY